jgi:hypothetical protein
VRKCGDCWLEVDVYPDGPATVHFVIDICITSVFKQLLRWFPGSCTSACLVCKVNS